jgi:hypothetical protein
LADISYCSKVARSQFGRRQKVEIGRLKVEVEKI